MNKWAKSYLNCLPNGITVGANDHSTPNRTVISQLGVCYNVEIPSIEILRLGCYGLVLNSTLRSRVFGHRRYYLLCGGAGEFCRREGSESEAVAVPEKEWGTSGGGGEDRSESGQSQSPHSCVVFSAPSTRGWGFKFDYKATYWDREGVHEKIVIELSYNKGVKINNIWLKFFLTSLRSYQINVNWDGNVQW